MPTFIACWPIASVPVLVWIVSCSAQLCSVQLELYINAASIDIYTWDIFFELTTLLAKTQRIIVMTISGKVLPTIISICIRRR